ncbi:MAG: energy-coupling factor ABC transporter permease [Paracoccaceae bacterium]|uniref:energy-coupling factor ABC transporter permease n=1 Tax=Seohaeicola saemankumensis TaxID=481181 RepID=UPI001E3E135D|nr:energy-coupling factor ABC transporter permease [Seohaeicola saemankumensis]MCD1627001.1 energy-coupling factor ABC transporter permease [Seohaeicola saemankumensis]
MHIEPGLVDGAKISLSYATAAAAGATGLWYARHAIMERGTVSLAIRSVLAAVLTFFFFEVLPTFPVGVSEVHFILGSTLFLILGAGPSAIGLVLGLLIQGMFFSPSDLPQFAMNMTTLLVPLFALTAMARRIIAPNTAYVDLKYSQVLALSACYQGGVVAWVAFWAIYGMGTEALAPVGTFAFAYMAVIILEPLADLAVLAGAKALRGKTPPALVTPRLYSAS